MVASFVYSLSNISSIPFDEHIVVPSQILFPNEPVLVDTENVYKSRNDTLYMQWSIYSNMVPSLSEVDVDDVVTVTFDVVNEMLRTIQINVTANVSFRMLLQLVNGVGKEPTLIGNYRIEGQKMNEIKVEPYVKVLQNQQMRMYDIQVWYHNMFVPLYEDGYPKDMVYIINF
jgi:hypothetical protein